MHDTPHRQRPERVSPLLRRLLLVRTTVARRRLTHHSKPAGSAMSAPVAGDGAVTGAMVHPSPPSWNPDPGGVGVGSGVGVAVGISSLPCTGPACTVSLPA